MTRISFINRINCLKANKELTDWSKTGGFETTITANNECFDFTLSPQQCKHAADQFQSYSENGEYYSNIIAYPHFSHVEQEAILNIF